MIEARAIDKNRKTKEKIDSKTEQDADPKIQPHIIPLSSPFKTISNFRKKISNKLLKRIPQFKNLPIEIRLIIWEYALPGGCVHELHPCTRLIVGGKMRFRSNHSKPSPILSVCQESRKIALQNLQLFRYRAPTDTKRIRPFYFNPKTDTLFLNTLMGLYMAFMLLEAEILEATEGTITERIHETETEEEIRSKENEEERAERGLEVLDKGVMRGWQNIALDADRTHLLE